VSSHKTILTELGPLPKASSEPCGCDKRGDRTFFCTYHQGVEDEREACAKVCDEVSEDYYNSITAKRCAELIRNRGVKQ